MSTVQRRVDSDVNLEAMQSEGRGDIEEKNLMSSCLSFFSSSIDFHHSYLTKSNALNMILFNGLICFLPVFFFSVPSRPNSVLTDQ